MNTDSISAEQQDTSNGKLVWDPYVHDYIDLSMKTLAKADPIYSRYWRQVIAPAFKTDNNSNSQVPASQRPPARSPAKLNRPDPAGPGLIHLFVQSLGL
jgi:hypothetical protein